MSYLTQTSYLYMIYVIFLMVPWVQNFHSWHLFGIIFPLWSHVATAPGQQMDANGKAWRINLNSSVKIDMTTCSVGVFAYQKFLWFQLYVAQFCTSAPRLTESSHTERPAIRQTISFIPSLQAFSSAATADVKDLGKWVSWQKLTSV